MQKSEFSAEKNYKNTGLAFWKGEACVRLKTFWAKIAQNAERHPVPVHRYGLPL
jgi:hypothetical protein